LGGGRYNASIALYLILTIVTLGLFNLYWNYRQMQACNELLERPEFSWLLWILLCLVTFGLYHFYYQYKMGAVINEIQDRYDLPFTEGLPILSVAAAIIGFGVVADCIHQHELNKIDVLLD
jgi:ABC-type bacteriocin/lantibiotic exporter with double-glycine peptidase domain